MQYVLKVFETEDHSPFRTIDIDGELWFVASDVCRSIALAGDAGQHVRRLDEEDRRKVPGTLIQNQGGAELWVINESGLWALVLRSDKPEAKRFKRWLTSEVIPAIRKTGTYGKAKGTPLFLRRYSQNHGRVAEGHFSVIQVLATHLYGPLEFAGHLLADKAADGKEMRPENSVGRMFSAWLKENHPHVADDYSYYLHWTPQAEFPARQYPNIMYGLFVQYLQTVWIPQSVPYFKQRDPAALPHLPAILPSPSQPQGGMMRHRTLGGPR